MLICLHCRSPFLFRLQAYPDYLVSPMARQIVVQVVRSYCSKTEVPNPVRMDTSEAARVQRFGKYTAKYSSINIIKNKLINYERWQKRWYVESKRHWMGSERFDRFKEAGYTPLCPGKNLFPSLRDNLQHLERAEPRVDENGILRNNCWDVCSDVGSQEPIRPHTILDLEISDFPNAMAIKHANILFMHQQEEGTLDDNPDDDLVRKCAQEAWYDIFGFRHEQYLHPDNAIPEDKKSYLNIIRGWGRSIGHGQTSQQANRDEMAAIAQFTGVDIPTTPAAAAGGRADQGGYYPHQPHPDKGAGRSTPYPRSSSAGSSWWPSSEWGSWSWSGWTGRDWWH